MASLISASNAGAVQRIAVGCGQAIAPRLCSVHAHLWHTNTLRLRMGQPRLSYRWVAEAHPSRRDAILDYWTLVHRRTLLRYLGWTVTPASPATIIGRVFGAAGPEAIAVARCESGLSPTATNGQYHGLFQLSQSWRDYFAIGEGYDAQQNAHAAYVIWRAQGWVPWSCKP